MSLREMLVGFEEWEEKIKQIASLNLPMDDFYRHLRKEAAELEAGRNPDEMRDVLNLVAMIYVQGNYRVNFRDCLAKLKAREQKYETERRTP